MASFGENLRRERELRGIELREMADATKISIRFLQALEQDRVDILPGGIFPRAFVRQYAKHVGLDPERLVAEFVFAFGAETEPVRAPRSEVGDFGPPRGLILAGAALLVLALVGWRLWGRGPEVKAEPPRPSPSAALATRFPDDRVYPPPGGAAAAPAAGLVVALTARKNSWVEARVDGSTVMNRVMTEGETQRLEARGEIQLSVGNAGGVEYSVNGRPATPLGRDGEVRRNVVITADGLVASPLAGPAARTASARPRRSPAASPLEPPPAVMAPAPVPSPSALP